MCFTRRVKGPLIVWQDHTARLFRECVRAQQGLGLEIANFEVMLKQAHQYDAPDGGWTGGVAAVVDPYAGIVVNGALALGEVLEALQRQWPEHCAFLLKHDFDLTPGA